MKTLKSLGPLAVALAAIGVAIYWLLANYMALGKWVLAAVLFGHGWVHAMYLMPRPAPSDKDASEWPFDLAESWLVTRGRLSLGAARAIGRLFVAAIVIGFLLAALSTVGLVVPAEWWPGLVVVSAGCSALMLALFFSPQLVLGLAIDAILVWVVVANVWRPTW